MHILIFLRGAPRIITPTGASAVFPLYFSKENKSITCNLNEIYYRFSPIIAFIQKYDVEKMTKSRKWPERLTLRPFIGVFLDYPGL